MCQTGQKQELDKKLEETNETLGVASQNVLNTSLENTLIDINDAL